MPTAAKHDKRKSPQKAVGYRTVRQYKPHQPTHSKRTAGGNPPPTDKLDRCPVCGSYEMWRRRRGAKYCSVKCRVQAFHQREKAKRRGLPPGQVLNLRAALGRAEHLRDRISKYPGTIRDFQINPMQMWRIDTALANLITGLYKTLRKGGAP